MPADIARRLTKIVESGGAPVDRMKPRHHLAHRRVNVTSLRGRKSGQRWIAEYAALGEIHQIEGRADHRGVFAQQMRRYDRHIAVLQGVHRAKFALYHMSGRQQLAGRLLAEDVAAVAALHQKRGIGLTAAKLADRYCRRQSQPIAEVTGETRDVELVSRTDVGDVGESHWYSVAARW